MVKKAGKIFMVFAVFIAVFLGTAILVAWLLEDVIAFSLMAGIPAGFIAGILVLWLWRVYIIHKMRE